MSFESINNVQTEIVKRIRTGLSEIDFLYGSSYINGRHYWGIPEKAISLWAGEGGIGKSRLATEIAKVVARRKFAVLYFQNEYTKGTFASNVRANGDKLPSWFYIS